MIEYKLHNTHPLYLFNPSSFMLVLNCLQTLWRRFIKWHLPCKTSDPSSGVGQVSIRDRHHKTLLIFNMEMEELWNRGRLWRRFTLCRHLPPFPFALLRRCFCLRAQSQLGTMGRSHWPPTMHGAAFHWNPFFLQPCLFVLFFFCSWH